MSQFEFLSVAQSVICSLIAARVLSHFAVDRPAGRSYPVHSAWLVFCLVSVTTNWWIFWSYVDVSWTYPRFVLSLAPTGFVYMMTATMAPQESAAVLSWRDHFYKNKNKMFAYGLGYTLSSGSNLYLLLDVSPVRVRTPALLISLCLLIISVTGIASSSHRVHVLVALGWVLVVSFVIFGPLPMDFREWSN